MHTHTCGSGPRLTWSVHRNNLRCTRTNPSCVLRWKQAGALVELDEDNPLSKLSSRVVLDGAAVVQVECSVPCIYSGSGLYGRHCLPESNRFPTLTKCLSSTAVRWVWRSAKPAFGSKSQNLFPWPSTQYLWNGTAQAQCWDFLPCPGRVELQGQGLWDLCYSQRSNCREQKLIKNSFYFCYDQWCFLGNQNHSESFMPLHSLSPLPSYLLWVNFKAYP